MYPALFCLLALLQAGFAQEPEGVAISRLLSEHHVPGVSIARIKGGKLVQTTAYGQQSAEVAATPDTIYNIASLTKPISAEVALRLISNERSFSTSHYKAWTDPDIAGDERRKSLTPRIALSHQTGFANWRSETGNVLTFRSDPGKTFGYSGEGYEYVARFLEKKTCKSLKKNSRENSFLNPPACRLPRTPASHGSREEWPSPPTPKAGG